jgi:hypothetical protein
LTLSSLKVKLLLMVSIALKLNEIVSRGRLKLSTVQYALKHPDLLPDMPEAGSQGRHRMFTVQQAMRLAICTRLVMAGVPLADAALVVQISERRARTLLGIGIKQPLRYGDQPGKHPWTLRVFDGQHFQVWQQGRTHRLIDSLEFWNLSSGEWRLYTEEPLFDRYELNLSNLERQLVGGGR